MNTHAAAKAPSRTVAEATREHPTLVAIARLGWFAKGGVYVVLGVLAVPIAWRAIADSSTGQAAGEASQTGAVARIAETSLGTLALWVVGVGLLLYVLWRVLSIFLPTDGSLKAWVTRVGYAISAATYVLLSFTAISLAQGSTDAESEESRVDRYAREFLETGPGRWVVGILGVVIVAVGAFFVYRGVAAKFRDELEPGGVGPLSEGQFVLLGRIGWTGRGLVLGVVGWFLAKAAIDFRPEDAVGFDGALHRMTENPFGGFVALFVAVALAVYGVFCLLAARKVILKPAG